MVGWDLGDPPVAEGDVIICSLGAVQTSPAIIRAPFSAWPPLRIADYMLNIRGSNTNKFLWLKRAWPWRTGLHRGPSGEGWAAPPAACPGRMSSVLPMGHQATW